MDPPPNGPMALSLPHCNGCGQRYSLGELKVRPGLQKLSDTFGTDNDEVVVVSNTVKIIGRYAWQGLSNYQYVRG